MRVWDLQAGRQHGEALTGHDESVAAVAVGELDGRPIAVSAGGDRALRVWTCRPGANMITRSGDDGSGGVIVGATPGVLRLIPLNL